MVEQEREIIIEVDPPINGETTFGPMPERSSHKAVGSLRNQIESLGGGRVTVRDAKTGSIVSLKILQRRLR